MHLTLHFRKRNVQHFFPRDENQVRSLSQRIEHRRNAGAKPPFGAVPLDAVADFFGNRKPDLDGIGPAFCPDQGEQMRADRSTDTVGVAEFFMPFQRIGTIHRYFPYIQQLRQAKTCRMRFHFVPYLSQKTFMRSVSCDPLHVCASERCGRWRLPYACGNRAPSCGAAFSADKFSSW